MQKIESVGIIGLGQFGAHIVTFVPESLKVLAFDPHISHAPGRVELTSLDEVAVCDVVILAVPLASYEEVLTKLAGLLDPESLLVDICSVKTAPEDLIRRYLPEHGNLLFTHPLFGPGSTPEDIAGLTLIVTGAHGARARQAVAYLDKTLKLKVVTVTPREHDQTMAATQALTFFLSRALKATLTGQPVFQTPSYDLVKRLADHDFQCSDALYDTIVRGNPYAAKARESLLRELSRLDQS
jgi:prephenate dehydrogenase